MLHQLHTLPTWAWMVRDLGFPIAVAGVLLYALLWRQPAELAQLIQLEQHQLRLLELLVERK